MRWFVSADGKDNNDEVRRGESQPMIRRRSPSPLAYILLCFPRALSHVHSMASSSLHVCTLHCGLARAYTTLKYPWIGLNRMDYLLNAQYCVFPSRPHMESTHHDIHGLLKKASRHKFQFDAVPAIQNLLAPNSDSSLHQPAI